MAVFQSFHEPGFWLVISLLVGVALVAGRLYTPRPWRDVLVIAYWLGVPYVALLTGAVSPRLMGLRTLNWTASFQLGAALLLTLIALATIARLVIPGREAHSAVQREVGTAAWKGPVVIVAMAGAEQLFWCFLRGATWELMLTMPQPVQVPAYWAVWLAALFALPLTLFVQTNAAARLIDVAILLVTSVVFFYTRNFWVCVLVHAAIALLMGSIPDRMRSPAANV
jgi:hypothetical protein